MEDKIISILRNINKNLDNSGSNSSTINPEEMIPLKIPPTDTIYYRTHVNDATGVSVEYYNGATGLNTYSDKGIIYIDNGEDIITDDSGLSLKNNNLVSELSFPDEITRILLPKNIKSVKGNNLIQVTGYTNTLWYQQLPKGLLKLDSILLGCKGETPKIITSEDMIGVKNIAKYAFSDTHLESIDCSNVDYVGCIAFLNTPFYDSFQDGPVYIGNTLYALKAGQPWKLDVLDIPDGIKYINDELTSENTITIHRINIPSTLKYATTNLFSGKRINGLFSVGLPNILPKMSNCFGSNYDVPISQIHYNGTVEEFNRLLLKTGTEWLDGSLIKVIHCTDDDIWLEDVSFIEYTTIDNEPIYCSLTYDLNKLMYKNDSQYNNVLYSYGSTIESLTFPEECDDVTHYKVIDLSNLKYLDLSKTKVSILPDLYAADTKKLQTLLLPETLTRIEVSAFINCEALSEITLYAKTPPLINEGNMSLIFYGVALNIPVYVPNAKIYREHSKWGTFTNFIPLNIYNITLSSSDDTMGHCYIESKEYNDVTITAVPHKGYKFTQWNDGNTENPRTLYLEENTELTAIFKEITYNVEIPETPGGSVTGIPGDYKEGEEIVIEAVPDSEGGYYFVLWSDGSTENPRIITVTKDMLIYAVFLNNNMILYTTTDEQPITIDETADFGSTLIDNLYN